MKKLISLLLIVCLALTVFAGCSKTAGGENAGNTGSGTETSGGAAASAKDTMIIGHWGDPPTLDPNNAMNDCTFRVTTNVYDTLVRMDSSFASQPCLAESWSISDDGLEYTFKIRQGVKFHDGSELTVDDVVYSVERGIGCAKSPPSYSNVDHVEAVGDNSVKIVLKTPSNITLARLALPFAPIVSKAYVEKVGEETMGREPMGTGPFKFVSWTVGEKVIIEANEAYWDGAPSLKKIELVVIADTSAALLNLESGDIDAYCDIATSDYEVANSNSAVKINEGAALGYEFLQFNLSKAPFDDVRVRQAVTYAIDKASMLIGINDNIGTVVDTVVLEGAVGYTDKVATYEYNMEKAKALLKEAGYGDGFSCTIHVYMDLYAKYAQVLQSSLYELGIDAKIVQEELSAYKVSTQNGNYDIAISGCSFTAMDVYEAVGESLDSSLIGETNTSFYNNARMDELLAASQATADEEKLAEIYSEILVKISEDLPLVPLIWRVRNVAANADLNVPFVDPYGFQYFYSWSWK